MFPGPETAIQAVIPNRGYIETPSTPYNIPLCSDLFVILIITHTPVFHHYTPENGDPVRSVQSVVPAAFSRFIGRGEEGRETVLHCPNLGVLGGSA